MAETRVPRAAWLAGLIAVLPLLFFLLLSELQLFDLFSLAGNLLFLLANLLFLLAQNFRPAGREKNKIGCERKS